MVYILLLIARRGDDVFSRTKWPLYLLASAWLLVYGWGPVSLGVAEGGKPTSGFEKEVSKSNSQRETRMRASGVVTEITSDTLIIERNITGEVMEFRLEKPLAGIAPGDKVTVSYVQKEERNTAKRVTKIPPRIKTPTPAGKSPDPSQRP